MKGSESSRSSTPRFQAATRWVLAAVSLLLPFVFRGTLADPFQLPKVLLFRWGALLVLGLWLSGALASGQVSLRRSRVAPPLLLLIFIAMLSVFQAPSPGEASSAVRNLVFSALVLFLSLSVLEEGGGPVSGALGAGAALTAVLGTLQLLLGPRLGFIPPTQGGALVGDVSTAAVFVAMVLPLLLELTTGPPGGSWIWAAGTGICLGYLVLARSRAAWLGAIAGLLVFGLISLQRLRKRAADGPSHGRWQVLSILALALLIVAAGVFGQGISPLSSAPSLKTAEIQGPQLQLYTWQATLRMILSRPLGVGAGSWRRAFPQEAGNLAPEYPFSPSRLPQSADNEYLETAAELGAAGLFLLLWIVARLFAAGWRKAAAGEGCTRGATASLASLAVCGLLASPLREQPTLWGAAILAALALAPIDGSGTGKREVLEWSMEPSRRRIIGPLAGILFALLLAISAWDTVRDYVSSRSLQIGQTAYMRGDCRTALPALDKVAAADPASGLARYLEGSCALAQGDLDRAETELRVSLALDPQDAAALIALASSLQAKGRVLDAIGICEKALKIWPRDEEVNLALGDLRNAAGDFKGSVEAYKKALEGNPYSVKAYLRLGILMEEHSQLSGAVSSFAKAVELDPYHPETLPSLGGAYMKQGNYEAAIQVYNQLLASNPGDLEALVNLARVYAGLQRPCDALTLLRKARDLDKDISRRPQMDQAIAEMAGKCGPAR